MVQSVLLQNHLERNGPSVFRLGECGPRVTQVGRIVGRFQTPQVICRNDRRHGLTMTFDDDPFPPVFGATEHIGKAILRFGDCHGGHRPLWPIWPVWTSAHHVGLFVTRCPKADRSFTSGARKGGRPPIECGLLPLGHPALESCHSKPSRKVGPPARTTGVEIGFDALTAAQAIRSCASTEASLFNGPLAFFITALGGLRSARALFGDWLVAKKPTVC